MSIWFKDYTTGKHGSMEMTGLNKQIGIKSTEMGDDYQKGTMPFDDRTIQPGLFTCESKLMSGKQKSQGMTENFQRQQSDIGCDQS